MADDCEFWLLPEFLAGDGLKSGGGGKFDFGSGYGSGSGSDLSSPVESVKEGESDDEYEYMYGLSQEIARATLVEHVYDCMDIGGWRLSGSPESTLCGVLGGGGSTNCSSRASSPPLPPELQGKTDGGAWDTLYAAAGDVARMKMTEESAAAAAAAGRYPNRNKIWTPSPIGSKPKLPSPGLMNSNQNYHELQLPQFQGLKQNQMEKQSRNGRVSLIPSMNNNPRPNMSAWPTLQQSQQPPPPPCRGGSGMRAVFIGNPGGPKTERTGTGVFIPRTTPTPSQPRQKKPVCSTVLLPERVVHALNLNFEDQRLQHKCNGRSARDHGNGGSKNHWNNGRVQAQPRRNQKPSLQELRLPQEWTY